MRRLRRLKVSKVALVDAGAGLEVPITLWKRRDPPAEVKNKMELKDLLAAIAALSDADKAALLAELAPKEPEPEMKADPAEETPAEKSLRKRLDEEKAERVALEKKLAQIEEAREIEAIEKKVEIELPYLPGSVKQIAKAYRAADEDTRAMLKRCSELLAKSSALREWGARGDIDQDSPLGRLNAIAKKLREEQPSLTDAAAFTKAIEKRPDIYREHAETRRASAPRR